jgi:hypothetical protein
MIQFTNPDTAAGYNALTEVDQFVHVPARQGQGKCYQGNLSGIDPQAAERYIRFGGNLIERKAVSDSGTSVSNFDTSVSNLSTDVTTSEIDHEEEQ